MAAASPAGGSAVSATAAKPPAETPTAIMPVVETSVRPFIASMAARKSLTEARRQRIVASSAWTAVLGIVAAGIAIPPAHDDEGGKTAPGEFKCLPIGTVGR